MTSVDVLTIELDMGYVSSIRTRNSTRENIIYEHNYVTNKQFRRKLICHFLFRVRKRRSQSVLPWRFCFKKPPALGSSVHMLKFLCFSLIVVLNLLNSFISRNVKTKSIEEMLTLSPMLPVTFAAIVPVLSVSAQVDNHWTL